MIIFIYGSDTFRSREKLREIISQFQIKRDSVGMNVVRLAGEKLNFDRLRQETMTQGFLSPKKMIVIENLLINTSQETLENISGFLKDFTPLSPPLTKGGGKGGSEDNVLVFWQSDFSPKKRSKADQAASKLFDFLKKQKYKFNFPEMSGVKLTNWVKQRVTDSEGNIDSQVASELAALVGSNLWQLSNDIDKLVAFKGNEKITGHDLAEHVRGKFEENIFALTDAIAQADKTKALELLNKELAAGANEMYILSMITRQFRILLQLQAKLSSSAKATADQIAKDLKLHPFVVKKSLPAAKKYTFDQLKNIYNKLLSIDQNLKLSHPNPQLLLDALIVD